ncbi:MAG TPA: hypothetical protein VFZ43_00550 [Anaerolineales bacterium]
MIVEFIGSTGAGKTTLISEVQHRLAQTAEVTTSFELVSVPFDLQGVTHLTARNLIQELVGFPFFIGSLPRRGAFIIFILRMLARQPKISIFMLNNLRSLERKIGVYEIIKRFQRNQIVLVDEGTVLTAHNVFVYSHALYTDEEIARFADLVPLPDIIVYIKAPVDVLVQRSLKRADPPRELKSKNRALIEKRVRRAVEMFDQLVEAENIRSRLLTVENSGLNQNHDMIVNEIVDFIMNHRLVDKSV